MTLGESQTDISPAGDGGVLKEVLRPGEGDRTPGANCRVSVHYTGTLLDGTVFDSSRDRGQPFEFNLGKGQVIKAWDIGVATMAKGELAKLICRSDYAYGKSGSPPKIPPDATLCFEVEVIDWQKEDLSVKKDGGILRDVLEPGEGHATPNDGSLVNISLKCHCNGRLVDERDLSFCLGEGSEVNVPPGIEKALEKFKIGEKSELALKAKYAWGETGNAALNIPPNADVMYTLKLKDFEKCKESWELDSIEKLKQGQLFKEKGTNYFKENKLQLALKMYKKAAEFIDFDGGFMNKSEEERKAMLVAVHLNSALCLLKLTGGGHAVEAREQCDKALALDPNNVKGIFRRGQANLTAGEPEAAKRDFEAALRLEPDNKAAAQQVAVCVRTLKQQKANEKRIYANMFDTFARKDREEKDSRFGWWDGKAVQVEKMEENPVEDEEDPRKLKIKEYKAFIEQAKERRQRLQEELKAKNINTEEGKDEVLEEPTPDRKQANEIDKETTGTEEKEGGGGEEKAARCDEDAR